jgi:hypothetical protein
VVTAYLIVRMETHLKKLTETINDLANSCSGNEGEAG